jgi:peroxiredoxin
MILPHALHETEMRTGTAPAPILNLDSPGGSAQVSGMALTPSTMLALGTPAPDFQLPNPAGRVVRLADFQAAPALVVMFICNHCPYVKHLRSGLAAFGRDALARGAAVVAINANDATRYPDDGPDRMAEEARSAGYSFPYLYDAAQTVAKAYRAACTPDFFLFDAQRRLVYRGQFDDSRPGNSLPVTGKDLRDALDAVLTGRSVPVNQKASIGCNIKWRPGNEPRDY